MSRQHRALVLINPRAGAGKHELVRHTLSTIFHQHGWTLAWQDLCAPITEAAIIERIKTESQQDLRLIIAAGGDGTASLVGHSIIQASASQSVGLGLFPSGTANTLAQELGIPSDWSAAAHFLATHAPTLQIDAMYTGDRYFFLRIGIGLDAEIIRETRHAAKRRLVLCRPAFYREWWRLGLGSISPRAPDQPSRRPD
jgi:diacylglycerol kinase family enzyme